MPTPNFKLLANSLRLGQPPDATAAIKVLVEVVQHQEGELAELRARVGMLISRLQFSEAKLARFEATGVKVPAPAPTLTDAVDLRMDEESSDSFGSTLSVRRVDIDAVVERVVAQEPYPMAPAGTYRPPQTTGMPFKPALPLHPTGGALVSPRQPARPPAESVPYVAIDDGPQDLSMTAEVEAAEAPESIPFPGATFAEDTNYDDNQMTNILKRKPNGDG